MDVGVEADAIESVRGGSAGFVITDGRLVGWSITGKGAGEAWAFGTEAGVRGSAGRAPKQSAGGFWRKDEPEGRRACAAGDCSGA